MYPFPFLVSTCIKTGPCTCLLSLIIFSNCSMSCPSTGPKYVNPISSKNIFGIISCFMLLFSLCTIFTVGFPITGILLIIFFPDKFDFVYSFFVLNLLKNIFRPPMFFDMLISLSFNITVICVLLNPVSFKASSAIPPVNAPSPITAITWLFSPFKSLALAIPSAADIDVLLCPVLKLSYSDSLVFGNPANPSNFLSVLNCSLLPVIILCVYDWCPTSHTILSFGVLNVLCSASVNSTTPKFDARCPPFSATTSIIYFLISSASCFFSSIFSFFMSSGEFIFSNIFVSPIFMICIILSYFFKNFYHFLRFVSSFVTG